MNAIDISNKRFGKLLVLYPTGNRKHSSIEWLCKCDCGNEISIPLNSLTKKTEPTRSCGCLRKDPIMNALKHKNRTTYYNIGYGVCSFNHIYLSYEKGAKRRNLEFNLTKEQFRELTNKNCFYCSSPPTNTFKLKFAYGECIYNGIDRVDNSKGYNIENCVPCCKKCNLAKGTMTQDEFYSWVKNVAQNIFGAQV